MIREALARLVERNNLTQGESEGVMREIMEGEATPSQIGAFLTALRMKGETVEEIAGCAWAMRAHAFRVSTPQSCLIDTCGTGGDNSGTFNISTAAALVVAGAGIPVAKHGNRAMSSHCGSADILEGLGVKIDLSPEAVGHCIDEIGIGFLFAPRLHPAMKHAAAPRRETGIRTIFNLLSPLTNPASASRQLLGVYDASLTEPIAKVLGLLGSRQALVVHGGGGLDELSTSGINKLTRLQEGGGVKTFYLDPQELGLPSAPVEQLKGGTIKENVRLMQGVLQGERGALRDVVLLNAAAALIVAEEADSFEAGLKIAAEVIDSGKARAKLHQLAEMSQNLD